MRRPMIAGNWKMNTTAKEAKALMEELFQGLDDKSMLPTIVVCPPFTSIPAVLSYQKPNSPFKVAAQNMDSRDAGAFTGEISAPMLLDLGVKHVIIGHSERRQYFGDTDETVNLKLKAALKHAMTPIVCVGESLAEREKNQTDSVVSRQITLCLKDISANQLECMALADLKGDEPRPLVIAYEPIWAIGTGKVCEAAEAERVIRLIRQTVDALYPQLGEKVTVLYGGSVSAKNIDELLSRPDIDGGLVGGASLKADEFLAIIQATKRRLEPVKSS